MKLKNIMQFLKFAAVGVANTLVDWAVFYLLFLTIFPDERLLAKAISFVIAAVNSFVLNSIWTFRQEFYSGIKNRDLRFYRIANYFIRFFVVSLVGFAINYLTFRWVISVVSSSSFESYSNIAGLFCASGAALVWNFVINKFWTYRKEAIDSMSPEDQKKKISAFKYNLIAAALLLVMATISFFVMKGDSGIVDEVAHIPAGFSYVKYNDYRLNPEHPPLAKYFAGIPLAQMDLKPSNTDSSWHDASQWENGWYFIYKNGNNADQILFWARIPMILLSILLGMLLYKWAVEALGQKAGLFVLFLYCFAPEILAHGHFVTTDVAAALGFTLAVYTFNKYLNNRTWKYFAFAAVGFGLAQLLKFSAFLLFAIFLVLIIVKSFYESREKKVSFWKVFGSYFGSYVLLSLASVLVVWLVYIPMVWNTPPGVEKMVIDNNLTMDPKFDLLRNFLGSLSGNPITRAIGHYLLGVALVFGRVAGGNSTFILSHFSDKSIIWFFPVAWAIKTPATIIVLTFFSLLYVLTRKVKNSKDGWFLWLLAVPFIIYWAISIKGSLNIGTRHLMPTIPFLYLFIGYAMKSILESKKIIAPIATIVIVCTLAVPVLASYPNYLGYFNIFTTGQDKYKLMVDSSLDWGQDLKRLADYTKADKIENLKIDYFGGSIPEYYIPGVQSWRSGYGPTTGWLAVSATFYQMSKLHGKNEGKWSYSWLDDQKPVKVIGTSILLFHITPQDLIDHPPTSPYPITNIDAVPMYRATNL